MMELKAKIAIIGFALIFLSGGIYLFLQSSFFAVQKVVVVGVSTLSGPEVVELAGIEPGTNIFAIRTEEVKRRLLTLPAIAGVSIERHLPSSITLEVQERRPVAVVRGSSGLLALDQEGFCIAKADRLSSLKLPLLSRQSTNDIENLSLGGRLHGEGWDILLNIAAKVSDSSRGQISEIRLDKLNHLSIYLLWGPEIRLGEAGSLNPEVITEKVNMVEKIIGLWRQGQFPPTTRYIDVGHQGFPTLGEVSLKE